MKILCLIAGVSEMIVLDLVVFQEGKEVFLGSTLESAVWFCIDLDSDFVVTHNKNYFNGNIIETVVIRFVAEHIQLCVSKHIFRKRYTVTRGGLRTFLLLLE